MTRMMCPAIPTQALLAWWLGELDEHEEARLDGHLLACATCAAVLREIVALGRAIRGAGPRGGFSAVLPRLFIERLKSDGLQVREYELEPGGSVACTVTGDDDLVVSYLRVPLRGVDRLDLLVHDPVLGTLRLDDVPFDPASGGVAVVPDIAHLRTLGRSRHRMQLVAVEGAAERVLADYTFDHSPS
ncbi:MAG TPA: hypothetical protein VNS57_15880 [Steroidobacteraceae bacterium]|nr:hypothetical protein [Steroidobacteraceae bacterium]